jgi:hypothetical protein
MLERVRESIANRGQGRGQPRTATATGPDTAADDRGSTAERSRARTAASGVAAGVASGTRRVRAAIATVISVVTGLIALLIVIGIAFVIFGANRDNSIVHWVLDTAKFFVGPLDGMFKPKSHHAAVAINWGIAAVLYVFVGRTLARIISPARRD